MDFLLQTIGSLPFKLFSLISISHVYIFTHSTPNVEYLSKELPHEGHVRQRIMYLYSRQNRWEPITDYNNNNNNNGLCS